MWPNLNRHVVLWGIMSFGDNFVGELWVVVKFKISTEEAF